MRILKSLRNRLRFLLRKKPVLLRSGELVLGVMDEPHRPRQSGLQEADYLLATGGQRLPSGDIDYPIDPEMLRSRYNRPIGPNLQSALNEERANDRSVTNRRKIPRMGGRARRVPAGWDHPKDDRGRYIPLRDGLKFRERVRAWEEGAAKWREGLQATCDARLWEPIPAKYRGLTYAEYEGPRPDPDEYTPSWPPSQCTHWQMYEEVSEGTPVSPVFGSADELARWMAEHDRGSTLEGRSLRPSNYEDYLSEILSRPRDAG